MRVLSCSRLLVVACVLLLCSCPSARAAKAIRAGRKEVSTKSNDISIPHIYTIAQQVGGDSDWMEQKGEAGETPITDVSPNDRPPQTRYPSVFISVPPAAQLGMIVSHHRHGARTPMLNSNQSAAICPLEFGCGALNTEGRRMMVRLGQFLADAYGVGGRGVVSKNGTRLSLREEDEPLNNGYDVLPTSAATPRRDEDGEVEITHYDPRSVRVVASSRDRAVQSGVGVLQGLYTSISRKKGCGGGGGTPPTNSSGACDDPSDFIFPLINNDFNDNMLYPTDVNPSHVAFHQARNATLYPYMANATLQFLTREEIYIMSVELGLNSGGDCDANTTGNKPHPPNKGSAPFDPYSCVLDLQDLSRYLYVMKGRQWLSLNAPTVMKNLAKLDQSLNNYMFNHLYDYDMRVVSKGSREASLAHNAGFLGYPLATSILKDMKTPQPTKERSLGGLEESSSSLSSSSKKNETAVSLLNPLEAQQRGVLRLKDYSSHDMTLIELTMAMGNLTYESMSTPLGSVIFFEVWVTDLVPPPPSLSPSHNVLEGEDTPSAVGRIHSMMSSALLSDEEMMQKKVQQQKEQVGTRHIRAFYGYPEDLSAGSNFTYKMYPYTMLCKYKRQGDDPSTITTDDSAADWKKDKEEEEKLIYEAPNGCPLDDFERYLTTEAGPNSPAGSCYMSDETRELLGCTHDVVLTDEDSGAGKKNGNTSSSYTREVQVKRQTCFWYRKQCPAWACARVGSEDYKEIADAASTYASSVPFILDQISNNCIRRFTREDEAKLREKAEEADKTRDLMRGIIAVFVIALFGTSGLVMLTTIVSSRREKKLTAYKGDQIECSPTESMALNAVVN